MPLGAFCVACLTKLLETRQNTRVSDAIVTGRAGEFQGAGSSTPTAPPPGSVAGIPVLLLLLLLPPPLLLLLLELLFLL